MLALQVCVSVWERDDVVILDNTVPVLMTSVARDCHRDSWVMRTIVRFDITRQMIDFIQYGYTIMFGLETDFRLDFRNSTYFAGESLDVIVLQSLTYYVCISLSIPTKTIMKSR